MDLRRLSPWEQPTADDYNALLDLVASVASSSGGGFGTIPSAIGQGAVDLAPARLWGKITGGGTGGKYSWTRVVPSSAGGGASFAAEFPQAVSGTTTVLPAVEVTGLTTVPVDSVVELQQSPAGPWFDFRYASGDGATDLAVAVRITGTLITATSPEIDYHLADLQTAEDGGPWVDGDEVHVINIGNRPLVVGERYVANKVGMSGSVAVYTARDDNTTYTISCLAGEVFLVES